VLQNPPAIRIGGMMSRAQYQFSLQDPDTDELYSVAPGFEQAMRNLPGLLDVNSDPFRFAIRSWRLRSIVSRLPRSA
jgi:hypothetical protein